MTFGSYKQYDSRWGKKNYNGSSNYAQAGCGPTACANILYAIDSSITPLTTGAYMQKNGFAIRNNGTAWAGIPACLKAFGAKDVQNVPTMSKVWELMEKGYVGVFLFRAGTKGGITWTSSGHYLAVQGYRVTNGKHYLKMMDSGGRDHDGWYCYETQMCGLIPQIWLCKVEASEPTTYKGTFPTLSAKHRFGHCANKKLDCVEIDFTYDTSASGAKHWTYVAVWKNQAYGNKAAQFVKDCIKRTPKIQYDDHPNLKKKLIANNGKMPSGSLTANCSNLMAAAVYYATGKEIADKGAKNQLAQLKVTGLFNIYTDGRQKKPTSNGAIYGCARHTGMGIEYTSVIKKGDKGDNVGYLQNYLKWYGIDLTADKDFGAITENAVKKFQSENGLTADGVVGSGTLSKMKEIKR